MKKRVDFVASILFITLALIFSAQTAVAQDPVKVDSKHYKVEAENAWVRVLRINYGLVELKARPAAAKSAAAEDPLKTDPQIYKAEAENDRVRVLRVKVGPHAKTTMHSHPANVVIFLTDASIKFSFPDGKTQEAQVKADQVLLDNPVKHAGENLSDKPAEVIVVELKGGATTAKPAAKKPGA